MRMETLLCLIICVTIGLTAADGKIDLKSVLLHMINKVNAKTQAKTKTVINLATSPDTIPTNTSKGISEMPYGIEDNSEESDEFSRWEDHKKVMIKGAIEQINDEIYRLQANYANELENSKNHAHLSWSQSSENVDSGQEEEKDVNALFEEMNKAAHILLLLRLKLANEVGTVDDIFNEVSKSKEENMQQNIITADGIDIPQDLQKQLVVDSKTAGIKERDWHSKTCMRLMNPCMDWYYNCCDTHTFKADKSKFSMCCSFKNRITTKKKGKWGICVLNVSGSGRICN